jgi:hypothetical protein
MKSTVPPPVPADAKPKKRSSVRHTRAIQRDRRQRPTSAPPADAVVERLTEIVHPATLTQVGLFHALGLRARVLTLPVMMGWVLGLLWRQIGGVAELVRVVQRETLLWVPPLRTLTQQALAQRLRSLPAGLFERVLNTLLPVVHARGQTRPRPVPPVIAWAQAHFAAVLIADGSTRDVLLRKIGLLRDAAVAPRAGRMRALLDLATRLPQRVWYDADPAGPDTRFGSRLHAALPVCALLIVDRGFTDFAQWLALTTRGVTGLTRAKTNLKYEVARVLVHTSSVQDRLVWVGRDATRQQVRLIEIQAHGTIYRYLTHALDPSDLPTAYAAALYAQRWRVEEAFAVAKRLLGLAYFYGGAQNAVETQLWATWILYAVLVDLTDAVAEALKRPYAEISMERVYRSLYFVVGALQRDPTTDPVRYRAEEARDLGIIKRPRKSVRQQRPPPYVPLDMATNSLTCE